DPPNRGIRQGISVGGSANTVPPHTYPMYSERPGRPGRHPATERLTTMSAKIITIQYKAPVVDSCVCFDPDYCYHHQELQQYRAAVHAFVGALRDVTLFGG